MFVVGLIVGPAAGLALVAFLSRQKIDPWLSLIILALVVFFILFVSFLSAELKFGLIAGLLAGALLAVTPFTLRKESPPETPET